MVSRALMAGTMPTCFSRAVNSMFPALWLNSLGMERSNLLRSVSDIILFSGGVSAIMFLSMSPGGMTP